MIALHHERLGLVVPRLRLRRRAANGNPPVVAVDGTGALGFGMQGSSGGLLKGSGSRYVGGGGCPAPPPPPPPPPPARFCSVATAAVHPQGPTNRFVNPGPASPTAFPTTSNRLAATFAPHPPSTRNQPAFMGQPSKHVTVRLISDVSPPGSHPRLHPALSTSTAGVD